jgi:hypothetical protein
MTRRSNLVIPDADVIIDLNGLGLWEQFLDRNDVLIAATVASESRFTEDGFYGRSYIDLEAAVARKALRIVDLEARQLGKCSDELRRFHADGSIDQGEFESIALALHFPETVICLKDRAAIRAAVLIGLGDRILSIESALSNSCLKPKYLPNGLSDQRFQTIKQEAQAERVQKLLG